MPVTSDSVQKSRGRPRIPDDEKIEDDFKKAVPVIRAMTPTHKYDSSTVYPLIIGTLFTFTNFSGPLGKDGLPLAAKLHFTTAWTEECVIFKGVAYGRILDSSGFSKADREEYRKRWAAGQGTLYDIDAWNSHSAENAMYLYDTYVKMTKKQIGNWHKKFSAVVGTTPGPHWYFSNNINQHDGYRLTPAGQALLKVDNIDKRTGGLCTPAQLKSKDSVEATQLLHYIRSSVRNTSTDDLEDLIYALIMSAITDDNNSLNIASKTAQPHHAGVFDQPDGDPRRQKELEVEKRIRSQRNPETTRENDKKLSAMFRGIGRAADKIYTNGLSYDLSASISQCLEYPDRDEDLDDQGEHYGIGVVNKTNSNSNLDHLLAAVSNSSRLWTKLNTLCRAVVSLSRNSALTFKHIR